MVNVKDLNPFQKKDKHTPAGLLVYKVLTFVSWLLVVVVGAYYTFNHPHHCRTGHCHTIWGQNNSRITAFTLNSVVTSIYWIATLILQAQYLRFLYSSDETYQTSSANVGSHFIFNNFLIFGFIMLWVRGYFWQAEILLIVNLFNLTFLYFENPTTPRFIHIPVVSAPFAWNYIAILWCGAAMINKSNLVARIFGNIVIWGILVIGVFYVMAFKDYTMGFCFTILTLALALGQFFTKIIAFQWIFAFIIMSLLFIVSILIGIPGILGEKASIRHEGHVVPEDLERRPLIEDD